MMKETSKHPHSYAQRIARVADLPQNPEEAQYGFTKGDLPAKVYARRRRQRQVMDLLMAGPVYCASPVRLSDVVHVLKREIGIEVETRFYTGNKETGTGDYGICFLISKVHRMAPSEVAA
jgi:hypothetical protein